MRIERAILHSLDLKRVLSLVMRSLQITSIVKLDICSYVVMQEIDFEFKTMCKRPLLNLDGLLKTMHIPGI